MDAGLMTWYAHGWKNVPAMSTCESITNEPKKTIGAQLTEAFFVNLTECKNSIDIKREVNYIEQVQIFITLTTTNRGEIEIYLSSPSNTKTLLLPVRIHVLF
jgi:subtilisin-like proprotein convertase family protein